MLQVPDDLVWPELPIPQNVDELLQDLPALRELLPPEQVDHVNEALQNIDVESRWMVLLPDKTSEFGYKIRLPKPKVDSFGHGERIVLVHAPQPEKLRNSLAQVLEPYIVDYYVHEPMTETIKAPKSSEEVSVK